MNGVQFFLTTTIFGAAFGIICLYFDNYRHKDPQFHRKLKLKRKKTRLINKSEEKGPVNSDEDKEARIFKEIELAENCMDFEDYSNAVVHFANAIAGCVDPSNFLRALSRTLPGKVFYLLIDRLESKYQDKMKTLKEDVKIKHLLKSDLLSSNLYM